MELQMSCMGRASAFCVNLQRPVTILSEPKPEGVESLLAIQREEAFATKPTKKTRPKELGAMQREGSCFHETHQAKIHVQKKPKPERLQALGAMQRKAAVSTEPTKKHVQKKPKPERVEPLVALQREGSLFHETHQETRPKEI